MITTNQIQAQEEENEEEQLDAQNADPAAGGGSNVINLDFSSIMSGAPPPQPVVVAPPQQSGINTSILDFNQPIQTQFNLSAPPLSQDQQMNFQQDPNMLQASYQGNQYLPFANM